MRILAAPAFKNSRDNPYNATLYSALSVRGVEVKEFSRYNAFRGRWDIVHVHWPDLLLHASDPITTLLRIFYFLLRLAYAKEFGAKIFWTVHNIQPHSTKHPIVERWLWRWFLPLVDASIHLSESGRTLAMESFPRLSTKPNFVISHGHYRDCYRNDVDREQARTRLGICDGTPVIGFVGQIKLYKNVPALVRGFLALPFDATLLVAGKLDHAEKELVSLVQNQSRIVCRFEMIPEDEMQVYLNACDLTVFPYREILNSGSVILALSFDRPVLAPAKGAMAEVQKVVGCEWMMTYDGALTAEILGDALQWARDAARGSHCDLSALDWSLIAEKTKCAYQALLSNGQRNHSS